MGRRPARTVTVAVPADPSTEPKHAASATDRDADIDLVQTISPTMNFTHHDHHVRATDDAGGQNR